uniref:Filamin A interacting protein 1 n=1 Tax=Nothobranchius furzeri TaxID=105023 RepID=A0A8C6KQR2_NOTFU
MRSRSCTAEGPEDGIFQQHKGITKQNEKRIPFTMKAMKRIKVPKEEKDRSEMMQKPPKAETPELSKEDLIHLLGIMEGEVQLDRLEVKQKETYRRMLEQLLLVEKYHRRTITELDSEKRKHADFITKSDDFTNLLEKERERLKSLLEQEKAHQAHKDQDHSRTLEKVQAELVKLKSFALMLVDEQQLYIKQMDQQTQKIQNLSQKLQQKEQKLGALSKTIKEDEEKVLKLEAELELQQAKFSQESENMKAKLINQDSQNQQLKLKLAGLTQRVEELDENNKVLQMSEDGLLELREKISKGECGNSSTMAELQNLRKKVLEMEGKDEEILKSESQCRELRKRMQDEENQSKELRLEIDKLQKRLVELEKLEESFNKSKSECSQLHLNLEKERRAVKNLASEWEKSKSQLKDLESSQSKLGKAEKGFKDDLVKLKSFTVLLVEERKNVSERLKQEEQKSEVLSKMLKIEQQKVTQVTEKLIEESKKLLKLKTEMEIQEMTFIAEKEELKSHLSSEEEKSTELSKKLEEMKIRVNGLEETKMALQRTLSTSTNTCIEDDNTVKELTLEVERLTGRLKQLEGVKGDLMKTEDEYDLLEKKFRAEQDKANSLSKVVEEMRIQMSRSKEKGETTGPEGELRSRCKMEEAKTRELQADIQALKEKIHELMNKEDQLSQLQMDFFVLQQRIMEEEEQKKSMGKEVEDLSNQLEAVKRYSRALRPSMNGRRMVDVPVTSTAVQTDMVTNESTEDQTAIGFIQKSVLEENHLMRNLRQQGIRRPSVLERYPPASAELRMRNTRTPWMNRKEAIMMTQTLSEKSQDSASPHPPDTSQRSGQPLHIRVMPDHKNTTATLEITSPRAEDFFSSTTIIPTLGLQKTRITIVPKPTTLASKTKRCDISGGLNQAKSPVTITTTSRTKSPEEINSSSSGPQSAVSIITVSTTPVAEVCCSLDHSETTAGSPISNMTSEKQLESIRKYKSNIVTTEDKKIHIHLGPRLKGPLQGAEGSILTLRPADLSSESRESPPKTVLHSPKQPMMEKVPPSKKTSSITITPIAPIMPTTSRSTQSPPDSEMLSVRGTATQIPVSLKSKATMARMEPLCEGQPMKTELRKAVVCSSAYAAGGKS